MKSKKSAGGFIKAETAPKGEPMGDETREKIRQTVIEALSLLETAKFADVIRMVNGGEAGADVIAKTINDANRLASARAFVLETL